MINIEHVSKQFGSLQVLEDISINIDQGDIFGIIGQSGAGKSTLLRCINGLEKYNGGSITVEGKEIAGLSQKELQLVRKDMGMIFQNFNLLGRLNVYDNVAFPMKSWGYKKKEIDERVRELIGLVDLNDKISAFPPYLSGGQKQRVAIARALTMQPKVLLCDEATSALDPRTAESILNLLKEINEKTGITIIVVAHQLSVIRNICTHMAILEDGHLACHGATTEIFMQAPAALRRLQGNRENHANLSVSVCEQDQFVFSRMARDLETDFDIMDIQHLGMRKEAQIHYSIRVPEEKLDTCLSWLRKKGIYCQTVEKEGADSV